MPDTVKETVPSGGNNLVRKEKAAPAAASDFADFQTERAVLAAILVEPDCLDNVATMLGGFTAASDDPKSQGKSLAADPLSKSGFHRVAAMMFRDPKHAVIYETMLELHSRGAGIDALAISDTLQRAGRLDVIGGMETLLDIQNSIASTANLETWCVILKDYAMLREMMKTCTHALDLCRNSGEDVKTLLEAIESEIYKVRNQFVQPEIRDIKSLIKETFDGFIKILNKEVPPGIPTGYPDLDRLIGGGLKPGEMFVLAARPSIGKTALALNIVRNIAMKGGGKEHSVLFFSLEMSAEQVAQRLLCTESRVPLSSILDGSFRGREDLTKLTAAVASLSKASLFIDPTGGISIFELRSKARKLKETHGIDLIVIDYLQLMKATEAAKDGRQVEVATISGGLKKLAKDLNVPVLVLAQLNREVEKGQGGKNALPKLSNLRESGAIEQDADVVVFLHRNREDTKESATQEISRNGAEAKLIVEKNRNGRTGLVELRFFPAVMEFRSMDHRFDESDIPPGTEM